MLLSSAARAEQCAAERLLVGRAHRSDEARARASAGYEHCTHTDASNHDVARPPSCALGYFLGKSVELASSKTLARHFTATRLPLERSSGRERTRRPTEASASPAPKTRVRHVSFELAGPINRRRRARAPGARLPEDVRDPRSPQPAQEQPPEAARGPSSLGAGSHHAQRK